MRQTRKPEGVTEQVTTQSASALAEKREEQKETPALAASAGQSATAALDDTTPLFKVLQAENARLKSDLWRANRKIDELKVAEMNAEEDLRISALGHADLK
ncbi:hypothetical protein AGDE_16525 [Angomonas deanei]|uniref:Uncharacterized protein n=1 Tax=Angomonas deanei TaxID=59799 RepID=A0A7G2C4S9_9TRYP|nr:hypothetical protein AGDE_16525 [Angomonas deanei]CAD2214730.1 hypothetical protein, conserved [Angomonas deanei]|eukprot:EPY16940.1 hypothetical protein AGDE_16525 [Angomonas deanei]